MRMVQIQHLYFVVDVDIKGFFDNVNHAKLMRQMWTLGIQDKRLLCIIKEMLKAPIVLPSGEKIYPDKGTPQGVSFHHCSPTSFSMTGLVGQQSVGGYTDTYGHQRGHSEKRHA